MKCSISSLTIWMYVQPGAGPHEDQTFQLFRVPQGILQGYGPTHGMPAEDYILITAGRDEAAHPFQVAIDVMARFARRMPWKVYGF